LKRAESSALGGTFPAGGEKDEAALAAASRTALALSEPGPPGFGAAVFRVPLFRVAFFAVFPAALRARLRPPARGEIAFSSRVSRRPAWRCASPASFRHPCSPRASRRPSSRAASRSTRAALLRASAEARVTSFSSSVSRRCTTRWNSWSVAGSSSLDSEDRLPPRRVDFRLDLVVVDFRAAAMAALRVLDTRAGAARTCGRTPGARASPRGYWRSRN